MQIDGIHQTNPGRRPAVVASVAPDAYPSAVADTCMRRLRAHPRKRKRESGKDIKRRRDGTCRRAIRPEQAACGLLLMAVHTGAVYPHLLYFCYGFVWGLSSFSCKIICRTEKEKCKCGRTNSEKGKSNFYWWD